MVSVQRGRLQIWIPQTCSFAKRSWCWAWMLERGRGETARGLMTSGKTHTFNVNTKREGFYKEQHQRPLEHTQPHDGLSSPYPNETPLVVCNCALEESWLLAPSSSDLQRVCQASRTYSCAGVLYGSTGERMSSNGVLFHLSYATQTYHGNGRQRELRKFALKTLKENSLLLQVV